MPEERLRLLTESTAQLRTIDGLMKNWHDQVSDRRTLKRLRDKLRGKQTISERDYDAIDREIEKLDKTLSNRGGQQARAVSFSEYRSSHY